MPDESRKLNVGQQLKARRQALRLSLAQVEIDTKIRGKFLTALESGDYSKLPNDVYSRGFVQHYANHLGLDGVKLAADYAGERGGVVKGETKRPKLQRPKHIVFTGRIVAVMVALAIIIGILGYLLWQFSALAGAPLLSVTSPGGDEAITGSVVDVSGHTTPGADVSVNDSPVLTDTDGAFSEKVALENGVNVIRITSRSKLGKITTVTRNILAKLPELDSSESFPVSTFAGIAIKVTTKRQVAISVRVDDGDQTELLAPSGWSNVYKGTKKITLSTNDAGAMAVTITNSTTANKVLPSLGKDGEARRNQEFDIDSVFP